MTRDAQPPTGFEATLAAVEALDDPGTALPIVAAALEEEGPVRGRALRFLLDRPGIEGAVLVVRGFANLDGEDRAAALAEAERLRTAAGAVLGDPRREGRLGLATFAAALPPAEGLPFILPLIDDPIEAVRERTRSALAAAAKEYLDRPSVLPGHEDIRRLATACGLVLRSPGITDPRLFIAALLRASETSEEARSVVIALASSEGNVVRSWVLDSLVQATPTAAASVLIDLVSRRPPVEGVQGIIRRRREPAFLSAMTQEAIRRMESPAGIPAPAGAALALVAWEAMPSSDLAAIPTAVQKKLLAIARGFRGDLPARARRIAAFLRSRDRKVREMTLDALCDYPPSTYKDDLAPLLEDPAEELQIRSAELLARAGTAECRRRLAEKARRASSERVRRFILGRLSAVRSPEAASLVAAGVSAPLPSRTPAPAGSAPIEEYIFPSLRPVFSRTGGPS
jgi:hypothetical protein